MILESNHTSVFNQAFLHKNTMFAVKLMHLTLQKKKKILVGSRGSRMSFVCAAAIPNNIAKCSDIKWSSLSTTHYTLAHSWHSKVNNMINVPVAKSATSSQKEMCSVSPMGKVSKWWAWKYSSVCFQNHTQHRTGNPIRQSNSNGAQEKLACNCIVNTCAFGLRNWKVVFWRVFLFFRS